MFERIKKLFNIKEPSKWETKWYIEVKAIRTTSNPYSFDLVKIEESIMMFFKEDQYGNRKVDYQMSDEARKLKGEQLYGKDEALWIETGIVPTGATNVLAKRFAN
jgi:hypothetical protein